MSTERPKISSRSQSFLNSESFGFFSVPFEKFREDALSEWTSALTLLDTIETFFDSRLDLLERRLKKHGDILRVRAEGALKRSRTPLPGELLDIDKEVQKFKLKVSARMASLAETCFRHSTKVVRTREKLSFFVGVMSLMATALMLGFAPAWIPIMYTVQISVLLPLRFYTYKQKQWHYFLFDLCYFCQILFLGFLWIAPWSPTLLLACYCLAHGSLASAVITWRNSLVFHDFDKITSLFIHVCTSISLYALILTKVFSSIFIEIYPPLVFTVIRHFYPDAEKRFPALIEIPRMQPAKALMFSGLIYIAWQTLYWQFVLVARRKKIESGQRTTSFSFLLNDKRGVIGRVLGSVNPEWREASFMLGQLVYALVTEIPCVFLLYDSRFWSGAFLLLIFGVSVWNGGGFYIEVFGRKFEKELESLRKELAEAEAVRSGISTPAGTQTPSHSEDEGIVMQSRTPGATTSEPDEAAPLPRAKTE